MKKIKKEKGITILALVITIVVILILAGISISALTGNNSMIKQAGKASKENDVSKEKELLELITVNAMDKDKEGKVVEENLKTQTDKYNTIKSVLPLGKSFIIEFNSGNKYIIDSDGNIKDKKGVLATEIGKNDIGNYVFNYSDIDIKDGGDVQKADWQLFYSGKVSNEQEDHIYLIASNLLNYDSLPKSKAGKTLNIGNSQYHANCGSVLIDYPNGPDDVEQETRYLNKNYFEYLSVNNMTNNNYNIKNVAYMCDTSVWNKFKTDKADFVIGAPTIELLFKSINKKYETNYIAGSIQSSETATDSSGNPIQTVSNVGSLISGDGGITWGNNGLTIINTKDLTYRIPGEYYWIASTSSGTSMVYRMNPNGIIQIDGHGGVYEGFRPIVRLKANTQLEEVEGGYRIIE